MRVVYATMNEIGRYALEELANGVDVVGVFTVAERGSLFRLQPHAYHVRYPQLAEVERRDEHGAGGKVT